MKHNLFYQKLFSWYAQNARDLPWRQTKDPYAIWVSEIMLQQTQVERVKAFYVRFMGRFPTVRSLEDATWEEVVEYWRGLGYYRRAKNLHAAAKILVAEHGGVFPKTFHELRKLPGIGDYTAAAIASFAFHQPVPALDTNLKRVFGRIFAREWDQLMPQKQFDFAAGLMGGKENAAIFNHALMDLGAMVCVAKKPHCDACPFREVCDFAANSYDQSDEFSALVAGKLVLADQQNKQGRGKIQYENTVRPKKAPLFAKDLLKVAAGVVVHSGKILISKRRKNVSFPGFWEFPGGKLESGEDERTCLKRELKEELDIEVAVRPAFHRVQTDHDGRKILLSFHRCSLLLGEPKALEVEEFRWVSPGELYDYQFPPVNREVIEILLKRKTMLRG